MDDRQSRPGNNSGGSDGSRRPSSGGSSRGSSASGRPSRSGPPRSGGSSQGQRSGGSGRPSSGGGRPSGARPSSGGRDSRESRELDRPRRPMRPLGPPIPEGVTSDELDRAVREDLKSLTAENAEQVGQHLVMVGRLIEEDPELAWQHAQAATARAGRVGVVRETAGLAAYHAGEYAKAITELRTARRISGSESMLPILADCERGLGRPEKALEIAGSPAASTLDKAGQVELRIVAAGARADMGQLEAAIVTLQTPELTKGKGEWLPRLRYAYADALLAAGREDEARDWFSRVLEVDPDLTTDAAERLAELDGIVFEDHGTDDDEAAESPVEEADSSTD